MDLDMRPKDLLIHGHIMVNTMQQEVDHQELGMIRQVKVDVEQESVESIFEQRPQEIAKEER